MRTNEIKHRAVRSIIALQGRTVFLQAISLVSFFLLGIFLSPKALGIFISVSALMRIFSLFTDLGLGAALVQKNEEIEEEDLKTTFTVQEFLVIVAVGIGILLTPLVSRFVGVDQSGVVLYQVLLLTLFISSLKAIPSILLERRLDFERQVVPQIFESLTFNLIVVALAYKGFEVASYSWAILVSALIGLPIYYYLAPWKVGLGISPGRIRRLISFGLAYQGKNVLAVVKDDLLTFFLSGLVGTAGIGFWGWAQRWAYSPFRLVVDSVTKVTFPAYARIQHQRQLLRSGIERSLFVVSAVLFPILAMAAILLPKLILLVPRYEKWQPALLSFYFLAAGAAVSALSNILVNALDATGRVKTTLGLMVMWVILTWGLTVPFVLWFGFSGIAIASFAVTLTIVLTIYLVNKVVRFSFLGSIWKPAGASVLTAGVVLAALPFLPVSFPAVILLSALGGIIYLGLLILLAKKELAAYLKIIREAYQR